MESPALISVIIPTRNRLEFLRESVASVQAQSSARWELIVVDDCSQDGTWDWLGSLGDARVRALRFERRRERSEARNAGLAAARGEYVLFLDDDDWLEPDALFRLERAAARAPAAIAACGGCLYVRPGTSLHQKRTHPSRPVVRDVWPDLLFGWFPIPAQMLIRRDAILRAGAWDETLSLCEDYEICLRLAPLGPMALIPQVALRYRIHGSQTPRAGAQVLTQTLARRAAERFTPAQRERASRSIRSRRLADAAGQAYSRDRYRLAFLLWLGSIRSAPWILRSPVNRGDLLGLGCRCLLGMGVGRQGMGLLRGAKRACRNAGQKRQESLRASQPEPFR